MASDVEVLTWLLKSEDGRRVLDAALMRAISALEALEAQPKVGGRMDDATLDEETEHVKAGLRASPKGGVTAFQCLTIELRRARASEAALSKRVEELERLARSRADEIIRLSDVINACGVCKGLI